MNNLTKEQQLELKSLHVKCVQHFQRVIEGYFDPKGLEVYRGYLKRINELSSI